MNIATLLPADQVLCGPEAKSKKRALEILGELLAKSSPNLSAEDIFVGLLHRERLGATGLGRGIAIPHTRLAGLEAPTLAMIKLNEGIDFGSSDNERVDILFALAVPENDTDTPLKILAMLAEMLGDEDFIARLRNTCNCQALHQLITHWHPHIAA